MEILKIIKHKDILEQELLTICKIKSAFGNYSIDSQKRWIDKNIKENDIHFLLYKDNEFISYLNLINITLIINENIEKSYGVGNVCSKTKGLGYGKKLFEKLNEFLIINNKIGCLFCRTDLVKFYETCKWKIIKNNAPIIANNNNIKTMIFNFCGDINCFEYKGNLF